MNPMFDSGARTDALPPCVSGAHAGPYHKQDELVGVSSPNASWPARTDETLSLFSRYFRREPDLVVLHANYVSGGGGCCGGRLAGVCLA